MVGWLRDTASLSDSWFHHSLQPDDSNQQLTNQIREVRGYSLYSHPLTEGSALPPAGGVCFKIPPAHSQYRGFEGVRRLVQPTAQQTRTIHTIQKDCSTFVWHAWLSIGFMQSKLVVIVHGWLGFGVLGQLRSTFPFHPSNPPSPSNHTCLLLALVIPPSGQPG